MRGEVLFEKSTSPYATANTFEGKECDMKLLMKEAVHVLLILCMFALMYVPDMLSSHSMSGNEREMTQIARFFAQIFLWPLLYIGYGTVVACLFPLKRGILRLLVMAGVTVIMWYVMSAVFMQSESGMAWIHAAFYTAVPVGAAALGYFLTVLFKVLIGDKAGRETEPGTANNG